MMITEEYSLPGGTPRTRRAGAGKQIRGTAGHNGLHARAGMGNGGGSREAPNDMPSCRGPFGAWLCLEPPLYPFPQSPREGRVSAWVADSSLT